MTEMQQVISEDGTKIAYEKVGTGPSLIIVGGTLADHHFYTELTNELAQHFTVYNVDRRGHGQSGDTAPYSVEREIEDLNALISKVGEPVFMYGHSAGSALALRAAAAGLRIAKLVLADPPYTPKGKHDAVNIAQFTDETAQVKALWTKGDHVAAATTADWGAETITRAAHPAL